MDKVKLSSRDKRIQELILWRDTTDSEPIRVSLTKLILDLEGHTKQSSDIPSVFTINILPIQPVDVHCSGCACVPSPSQSIKGDLVCATPSV